MFRFSIRDVLWLSAACSSGGTSKTDGGADRPAETDGGAGHGGAGHGGAGHGGAGGLAGRGGGGLGGDIFDFNSKTESVKGANRDVILDFSHGQGDKIDLSGIDAKSGGGNQAFHFIGTHAFHDQKGELHFVKKAGFVVVEGDVNGDGRADFQIQVDDVNVLKAGDFVL